jgi:hypothetical protein
MSSAKSRQRQARERVAQMRAEAKRKQRRRNLLFVGTIALVAVLLIGGVVLYISGRGSKSAIPGLQTFSGLSRKHVTGTVSYPQTPPVGGPHNPMPLNCGIYNSPVPNVNAVHSMEHGAVWITYRPGLQAGAVSKLKALVSREPAPARGYVILSPYQGLPSPVVASAWGRQLQLPGASDPRLQQFVSKFAASPHAPEPGAACSGGTGTPQP